MEREEGGFYARNGSKTTTAWRMRSISSLRDSARGAGIHPALRSFGYAAGGTAVRLAAYLGTLAVIGFVAVGLIDGLPVDAAVELPVRPDFSVAARSAPAFAVSQVDLLGKTETYEVLRHPKGGRKDVLRWAAAGERPIAELEFYRPGAELHEAGPAADAVAARMDPDTTREIEPAGVVASKFGTITLLGFGGEARNPAACLGFMTHLGDASLRISGYSCQGDSQPARRAAIVCLLNRVVLLSAGGDARLAAQFARAELRRDAACGATPASTDWIASREAPQIRGRVTQN